MVRVPVSAGRIAIQSTSTNKPRDATGNKFINSFVGLNEITITGEFIITITGDGVASRLMRL